MPGTATLDEKQVAELTDSLKEGTQQIKSAREEMKTANDKVDGLLKRQEVLEKGGATREQELATIKGDLTKLAEKMEQIANNHTDLVHLTRKQMKLVGESTDGRQGVYCYRSEKSHGALFESKRQAQELGVFFLATMRTGIDDKVKQQAIQWLKQNAGNLSYLPNFPMNLVQHIGNEFSQLTDRLKKIDQASGVMLQDLGGTTTPGSVLVRPEFANVLIRNVEEYGIFRQDALLWPMASDVTHIPRRRGGVSVFWEGENESGSTTDPDFDRVSMTAKKMFMLHKFSNELSMDSAIALADIIMFEFALAIAAEEDRIGFSGDGSGGNSPGFAGFVGVLGSTRDGTFEPISVTGAAGDDLSTETKLAKLRSMTGKLHTWSRQNASWYMNRTIHSDCDSIETGAGWPVVTYHDGRTASMLGYGIRDVEQMPTSPSSASKAIIALGNLRKSWALGDRRQMELETSEHYAFNTDQLTARVKQRCAFKMIQGDGMVVYVTGA